MNGKEIVLIVLFAIFVALVAVDGRRKLKTKKSNTQKDSDEE